MAIPASPFKDALDRFLKDIPGWKPIADGIPQGRKPGQVSTGRPASASSGTAFEEMDYLQREYWPAQSVTSSDGLFVIELEPIKSILLVGNNRARFQEPTE